jgi:hypothetical protein
MLSTLVVLSRRTKSNPVVSPYFSRPSIRLLNSFSAIRSARCRQDCHFRRASLSYYCQRSSRRKHPSLSNSDHVNLYKPSYSLFILSEFYPSILLPCLPVQVLEANSKRNSKHFFGISKRSMAVSSVSSMSFVSSDMTSNFGY